MTLIAESCMGFGIMNKTISFFGKHKTTVVQKQMVDTCGLE